MATWRRRDLERRSEARGRRAAQLLRVELILAFLALVVAAVALWQAMSAQARADLLAHDLSAANARLRNLQALEPAAPVRSLSVGGEGSASGAALAPLQPIAPSPRPGASPSP